jgi:hypothetical protein
MRSWELRAERAEDHVVYRAASAQALPHRPAAAARLAVVLCVFDAIHGPASAVLRFDLDSPIALRPLEKGASQRRFHEHVRVDRSGLQEKNAYSRIFRKARSQG